MCLRGASEVNSDVLAKAPAADLPTYVVWVPMLGGQEKDVAGATPTVPDPRALHYWDGAGYLVDAYVPVLGLNERAWDVYMIYGPDARWDGATPPKPAFWMHQLRTPDHALVLNTDTFRAKVLAALGVKSP